MLPDSIRVLEVHEVEAGFHARRSARAKTYWYNMFNGPVQLPTERLYAVQVPGELDLNTMAKGLEHIVGTHDFSSFEGAGSRDPENSGRGAVRTIFHASLETLDEIGNYRFVINGDGFLRHMVRNIVGTMLQLGRGKLAESDIPGILKTRDRSAAGPTAPAAGLILKEVHYE
jgi:tRNA pseudouridine38-40 synthase